jgi:hypothetical protein
MAVPEIPFDQFLLDIMRFTAHGDGYSLEKLFFQERKKIRFPKINRSFLDVSPKKIKEKQELGTKLGKLV